IQPDKEGLFQSPCACLTLTMPYLASSCNTPSMELWLTLSQSIRRAIFLCSGIGTPFVGSDKSYCRSHVGIVPDVYETIHQNLSGLTTCIKQRKRAGILFAIKEMIESLGKDRLGRICKREQRQAGSELQRIQFTQDAGCTEGLVGQHCFRCFYQPLTQKRVRQIGARFGKTIETKLLRR